MRWNMYLGAGFGEEVAVTGDEVCGAWAGDVFVKPISLVFC